MDKSYKKVIVIDNKIYELQEVETKLGYESLTQMCAMRLAQDNKEKEKVINTIENNKHTQVIRDKYNAYYSREHLLLVINILLTQIDLGIIENENLYKSCVNCLNDISDNCNVENLLKEYKTIKEYFVKYLGEY